MGFTYGKIGPRAYGVTFSGWGPFGVVRRMTDRSWRGYGEVGPYRYFVETAPTRDACATGLKAMWNTARELNK